MKSAKIILFSFLGLVSQGFASSHEGVDTLESKKEEFNARETIVHHILDAHDWHIMDIKHEDGSLHPVSIPLPIILYTEGQLDVFMSSAFQHGHASVLKGDREYVLEHNHITDKNGKSVLDFSLTKNASSILIAATLLLVVFTSAARSYKSNLNPVGLGKFMEPLVLFVRDDIAIPNIGEHKYKKYLPYLLTLFFFIWSINLLGLIPFPPGGANVTGNIAVTMVLAVFTAIIVNVSANKSYWMHIIAPPGVPLWLLPIMIPVELIGILSKPFALMIRLFANITAGHIVILSLISLIFIFKSVVASFAAVPMALLISVLELLVAALQAYIFTLLTALFIGLAVHEEEHH